MKNEGDENLRIFDVFLGQLSSILHFVTSSNFSAYILCDDLCVKKKYI